jgi:hypothetical protein
MSSVEIFYIVTQNDIILSVMLDVVMLSVNLNVVMLSVMMDVVLLSVFLYVVMGEVVVRRRTLCRQTFCRLSFRSRYSLIPHLRRVSFTSHSYDVFPHKCRLCCTPFYVALS